MSDKNNSSKENPNNRSENKQVNESELKQQQSDPQITELRGFVDPSVDLEPTLQDGTKSPDKEPPPNVND